MKKYSESVFFEVHQGYSCCGIFKEAITSIEEEHEHEFVETNVISAICVEDGKREFTCSICDEKYDVPIPKTGEHKYTEIEKVKPTCEKDGHKTFKCTMCCDTYNEILSKTG